MIDKIHANKIDDNNTKCDEFNGIHLPTEYTGRSCSAQLIPLISFKIHENE